MTRDEIRLEVLKLAQQLVTNQYVDERANLHNEWVAQSDELWRTRKLKLAYPPIPSYPTSTDVCNCAITLLNFIESKVDVNSLNHDNEMVEEVIETKTIPLVTTQKVHENISEEPLVEPLDSPVDTTPEETPTLLKRIKQALK